MLLSVTYQVSQVGAFNIKIKAFQKLHAEAKLFDYIFYTVCSSSL